MSPSGDSPSPKPRRWARMGVLVVTAALAAAALRFAWYEPVGAALLLGLALAAALARWISRRRLRRLLQSGDVHSVIERWAGNVDRVPYAATMGPLMTATAFAAYGWVQKARAALASAERGPAWDAALEHRLFIDTLLLTFEGDREGALDRAARLRRLPLPSGAPEIESRIRLLRNAISALARAFAHRTEAGDRELLEEASESSPLIYWAMRYAAAVVAADAGDTTRVRALLAPAPRWPRESAFHAFHAEILDHASRLDAGSEAAAPGERRGNKPESTG